MRILGEELSSMSNVQLLLERLAIELLFEPLETEWYTNPNLTILEDLRRRDEEFAEMAEDLRITIITLKTHVFNPEKRRIMDLVDGMIIWLTNFHTLWEGMNRMQGGGDWHTDIVNPFINEYQDLVEAEIANLENRMNTWITVLIQDLINNDAWEGDIQRQIEDFRAFVHRKINKLKEYEVIEFEKIRNIVGD